MQSFSNILKIICVGNQRDRSNILSARSNRVIRNVVRKRRYVKTQEQTYSRVDTKWTFSTFSVIF